MRRFLSLMFAVFAATSAQAIHYEWRYIMSIGPVAPNSDLWTPFRMGEHIMVGEYGGDFGGALVCGKYSTTTQTRMEWTTNIWGQRVPLPITRIFTNWLEMFVLTNYPNARFYGIIGKELNSGFEAVRLWDMEVNLPVTCPILDWSLLPPPRTNTAGIPVGWILVKAHLYDYGLRCLPPPDTNTPPETEHPKPPPKIDQGNGEYGKGMDYLAEGDFAEALKWFLKAEKKGHEGAKEQLRTNAHPLFVAWRGSNKSSLPPPAPPNTNTVSSNATNPPEETAPATNALPTTTPATNADAGMVAQLKEANAALERRVAEMEEQNRKARAPQTPPKTSSRSARWYWVGGILLAISALWLFSAFRREPE